MFRTLIALCALAITTAWAATPAVAADEVDGASRMILVLDSSGSMAEKTPDGTKRIDAAKDALRQVIAKLPAEQEVGLRVYGAEVFDRSDDGACTDSQLIVKPGTDNRDDLEGSLADYKPYGETPIGHALQEAGKDLGSEGPRTVVLVSDGEPTCDPDPCTVAAQLARDGVDVRIDVVGLDVSGQARTKLKCIAERGNGTYYDAGNADELVESLDTSTTRASRPFDLTGEPVEGTPTLDESTPVLKTGQYLDRAPVTGEIFYRLPRTTPGSTMHVGLINEGEPGSAGSGLRLSIYALAEDGEPRQCESDSSHDVSLGERRPFAYTTLSSWSTDLEGRCATADELIVGLEGSIGNLAGKQVELAVYEEPPLADPTARQLPPSSARPAWTTLTSGTPVGDVVPGTSIANAPVVEDGTYAFDINPGETQVVAVPLDWGQNVQAQLDATLTTEIIKAAAIGSDIAVDIIGPTRGDAGVSFYAKEPDDWYTGVLANAWVDDERDFRTGAQSHTIAYLNRAASLSDGKPAQLAGLHYIRVRHNVRGDDANLPYTLTIQHNGSAGEGAPEYAEDGDAVAPAADSRLTATPAKELEIEPGSEASSDSSGVPWLPLGVGAVVVLALGGAGAVAWRRRAGVTRSGS